MIQFATWPRWQTQDMGGRAFSVVMLIGIMSFFLYAYETSSTVPFSMRPLARSEPANSPTHRTMCNRSTEQPRILLWTPISREPQLNNTAENEFEVPRCKRRCYVTSNRGYYDCSHAIVFQLQGLSMEDLPTSRRGFQKWVLYTQEAPTHFQTSVFDRLNSLFNWTMTYRSDSDVPLSLGTFRTGTTKGYHVSKLRNIWMRKKRTAVWFPSMCESYSKREDFVSELQKYTDVDVYGDCGFLKLVSSSTDVNILYFSREYYFVLMLESSLCHDYVTPDIFTALQYNIVPVTMGNVNYSAITPPHSAINALSFASPKLVADYLEQVKMNFDLYAAYLDWKDSYEVVMEDDTLCSLCLELHSAKFKEFSLYRNLHSWGAYGSQCTMWNNTAWHSV